MNRFHLFLFNYGFLRPSLSNVKWWIRKRNIPFLEYAAQHGLHDSRREAIIGLGILNAKDSEELLIKSVDDHFRSVSFAAIDVLKKMNPSPELSIVMEKKEKYWVDRIAEVQPSGKWRYDKPKWERGSKKTLENVKELLRKPMNTGKWF